MKNSSLRRTRPVGSVSWSAHRGFTIFSTVLLLASVVPWIQRVTVHSDVPPLAAADLDPNFGNGGKVVTDFFGAGNQGHAVAIQSDGKIVVAGQTHTVPGHDDFAVVRYNEDGTLDTGFGVTGKVTADFFGADDSANAVAIQKDGRIVLAGAAGNTFSSMFGLVRLDQDGGLDTTFGFNGKVATDLGGFLSANAIAIASDGKIIVAGGYATGGPTSDFMLARYNSDGSVDRGFGVGGFAKTDFFADADLATAMAIQQDGKIVVAGTATDPSLSGGEFALARYNPDGSLDPTFGTGGKAALSFAGKGDQANAVSVQSDGRIVVAGFATTPDGASTDFALTRFNPNGSLDTGFGTGGKVVTDFFGGADVVSAIGIQLDGKILAAGSATDGGNQAFALARYDTNGVLDLSFGTGGVTATVFAGSDAAAALSIQADNKIVAAGTADDPTLGTAGEEIALARYDAGQVMPPPPPQPDFSISIDPAVVTAGRGTTINIAVSIARIAGFSGKITVSPSPTVAGISVRPGEQVTTADPSVTFTVKLKGKAPTGEQDLMFTGTDVGGRMRTATVKLIVQ